MPRHNPTLDEVKAAIAALPIREQFVEDEDERCTVYGLCDWSDPPTVTINEAVHVVETLLHEVFHALRPSWSEQTVDRRSAALFRRLNTHDIRRLHQRYRQRVRHNGHKRVV